MLRFLSYPQSLSSLIPHNALILALCSGLLMLNACTDEAKEQQDKAAINARSGQSYYQQGQYRAAINEYRVALKKSASIEYATALAEVFLDLNQSQAALNILLPLQEKFPEATRLGIAKAYIQKGKFSSALTLLQGTTAPANDALAQKQQFMLAQVFLGQKKASQALKQINHFEQQYGESDESALIRFNIALQQNNESDHRQLLSLLSTKYTESAKVNSALGQIALNSNDLDRAEDYFTAALEQLPKTDIMTSEKLLVLTRLSDALTRKGRFTEAMIYKQLIAEAQPDFENSQQEFTEAIEFISQGNYSSAEKVLLSLAERYPTSDRINALLGLVQLQQGDISKANLLLEKSVDPETASPAVLRAAAQANLQLSKPQQAVDLLQEALKQDPENPELLALYGFSASRISGLEKESEMALQKAVAMQPQNYRLRLALSQVYFRQGKSELGFSQLKIAADNAGSDSAIAGAYVKSLLKTKQDQIAIKYIDNLKKQYPNLVHPWQIGAGMAQQFNKPLEVQKNLDAAFKLDPNNKTTLLIQARFAQKQKQYQLAQEKYQRILELDPTHVLSLTGILATANRLGNQNEIHRQLNQLSDNGNINALAALAQLDLLNGKLQSADSKSLRFSTSTQNLTPYSRQIGSQIQRRMAQQAAKGKDFDSAIKHMQQALFFSPGTPQLLAEIAELHYANDDIESAKEALVQLRRHQNGSTMAAIIEASFISKTQPKKAIAILRQSQNKRGSTRTIAQLYSLEKIHDPRNSLNTLKEWNTKYPKDIRPLLELALYAQHQGQGDQAVSLYQKALALQPNHVPALNNLSWLYGEQNKLGLAIKMGEKAVKLAPNNPNALDTLGWNYHKAGDNKAVTTLQKALSFAPDDKIIQQHLKQAQTQ